MTVHFIFSAKNRDLSLTPERAEQLYAYLGGVLSRNGCVLLAAGGVDEHIQLLVSVGRELSVSGVARLGKSTSSRWIHHSFLELRKFKWRNGYRAFSVSYSQIDAVQRFIANPHQQRAFQDELSDGLSPHLACEEDDLGE